MTVLKPQVGSNCKERQLERGISDSDIDRAIEHGAIQPGSGKRRRVHMGGGVTAVIATGTNVAVTACDGVRTKPAMTKMWWSTEYVNMESQALQMPMETRTRRMEMNAKIQSTLDKHGTPARPVGSGRAVTRECKRRAKKMGARSAQVWMGWQVWMVALRERQCTLNDAQTQLRGTSLLSRLCRG